MDGVLFDSMPYHARAWTEVMTAHGIPFTPLDAYANEGRTGADTINEFFMRYLNRLPSAEELHSIYEEKAETFARIYRIERIAGVGELMSFLRRQGLAAYLVTGSGQRSLLATLDEWFPSYFNKGNMVTAFDVVNGKPAAEPYLKALQLSGLQPNEVFVVENAPLGVQSAVAAGLFTCAVNTGILPDEALALPCGDSGAVFGSMQQLLSELQVLPQMVVTCK